MDLESYIARAEFRLKTVENEISSFDFSAAAVQPSAYEKLNREYQRLSRLVACWQEAGKVRTEQAQNAALLEDETDAEFQELIRADLTGLEQRAAQLDRELKLLILPPHPNEGRDTIVEIRPAAGGEEAGLFAADLHRMYLRFAEAKGWRAEELDMAQTDLGGIKSVAFSLQGGDVYRFMELESGVHRVQRIPVTESGGRIHTSTVTVAVLAEAKEVEVQIDPEDLRIDVFRSQGPGGQSVNTTDSAVRVTHLPTGLVVASQQEKSQHRNRDIAMRLLRSRLLERRQAEEDAKNAAERRQQVGTGERSERIRTYNFPQNRVTDHRFGITLYDLSSIMEGDLEELLTEVIAGAAEKRLAEELRRNA